MSIVYGTGFETGSFLVPSAFITGDVSVVGTSKTGSYSLRVGSQGIYRMDVSNLGLTNEIYFSIWMLKNNVNFFPYIQVSTSDSSILVYYYNDNKFRTTFANGSIVRSINNWVNLQVYLKFDGTVGRNLVKVDGVTDIDFTGDTLTGVSSTITDIYFRGSTTVGTPYIYLDNFTIDDSNFPGDIRYVALIPNGDTATKDWTPSTGGTNYNLVDEVPASDSDYVYTSTTGQQDLYTLSDFDNSGLTPEVLIQWARARKETADTQQIKQLLYSGSTLSTGTAQDLTTSEYRYFNRIFETDPDTGLAWTDSAIDNLQIGIESVV